MPKFSLRAIGVAAVQWNGKQDDAAVRTLCDHYASLDHANPYVTENGGARYLTPGCWVVDLGNVHGVRENVGRFGVFSPYQFSKLFEPAAGKLIPPRGGSGTAPPAVDPVTLPRGKSSNFTGPMAERPAGVTLAENEAVTVWKDGTWKLWGGMDATYAQADPDHLVSIGPADLRAFRQMERETAPARSPVQPLTVVDRFGTRHTAVKWDGDADTANTFLGERYGTDWEYERVGSSAILLPTVDHGRKLRADVGNWIVKEPDGRLDSILTDSVMWDHFTPETEVAPPEVSVNGGPHTEDAVQGEQPDDEIHSDVPDAEETAEPVAGGIDGSWFSMVPPILLTNGFSEQPAPVAEYKIVADKLHKKVEEQVNELLAAGWELYGHLTPDAQHWIQSMVRRGVRPAEWKSDKP